MDYIKFGSTGLKVSPLAFGMVFREQTDESKALRAVEAAIDRGINFLDCANTYGPTDDRSFGPGRSERILAKAIKGKRDNLVITSKVDESVGSGPNDSGLSRYHILREIENSLSRLGTDHIDIYLAHHPDPSTPIEETVTAFDRLVRDGKIRYYGFCNFKAWQAARALWVADRSGLEPAICLQAPYNLIDRALEDEVFGLVRDQGLAVMAYSPLAVGLLTGVYSPDEPPPEDRIWGSKWRNRFEGRLEGRPSLILAAIREIASELGKTPAQVALAWVLARREVTVAILGCDDTRQLDENLGALDWHLGEDQLDQLNSLSEAKDK
jgi:1-deoxyxylulose-5-phosphate synthase